MKIIVPMAGRGSRFLEAAQENPEYKKPKPLINIKDKPMILWAIESLPFVDLPTRPAKTTQKIGPESLIFICRMDHQRDFLIGDELKRIFGEQIKTIFIDEITRGAAETVLQAKPYIDPEEEVIISDSDHHFDAGLLLEAINDKKADIAGIIPVFPPPDEEVKWSYSLYDENFKALAVGEKDPDLAKKGAYANIGAYYFSSWRTFTEEAEEMIRMGDMYGAKGKQEFYIAPIYQRLIKKGKNIKVVVLPTVWGLGTPKDVQHFLEYFPG